MKIYKKAPSIYTWFFSLPNSFQFSLYKLPLTMSVSITEKRRIALAYDGGEDARKLFEWSIKNIINPERDHLILLSAVSREDRHSLKKEHSHDRKDLPMLSTTPTHVGEAIEEISDNHPTSKTARERLEEMSAHLRTMHISSEEHILWGDPKTLIPRYTQNTKVDLLIVGSRGLGAVKSVFLGSVSDRCIHECPCPVLVVRNATI
ncbi:uncharacterized protein BYT42DRAFT_560280 [Radiomyces spectabilis]|uniref:uncharacterized protein n=1 Tax=Radiomyces spectabilis TaxID=64574 RepID=UPI00222039D0|nr:uncharacterized protein BYT42DRAFT_560280 [Radiomyces spectabilis]KAI8388498.1 hypothetical protein BYT42DRAFT_560280 [Radiomyces spectabilis]